MGCPDAECKIDYEHRITSLEGLYLRLSRDFGEMKLAVTEISKSMFQVKWAVIGASLLFMVKEIGLLALIKMWLNL